MTLPELCEPFFQYACRLNRMARTGASVDFATARTEVKAIMDELRAKASREPGLVSQWEKIELPLIFFIDSLIAESQLRFAQEWHQNRLAFERQELAGDEKFFDLMEETLKESSDSASERLAVFYTCLGLGFSGVYAGQPEYLRKLMMTLSGRIRHWIDTDPTARLCPEAYEGVDTRNLPQPATGRLALVGGIFLVFTVSVFIAYLWMFKDASRVLTSSLARILQQSP